MVSSRDLRLALDCWVRWRMISRSFCVELCSFSRSRFVPSYQTQYNNDNTSVMRTHQFVHEVCLPRPRSGYISARRLECPSDLGQSRTALVVAHLQ